MLHTGTVRALLIIVSLTLLVTTTMIAQNRLILNRGNDNVVTLRLANADPIAGIQFTLTARGVIFKSFEETGRLSSSALRVYFHLKDSTTLNVIFLAPYGTSLSPGDGLIARITIERSLLAATDSCAVTLNRIQFCDQNAIALPVTASSLIWDDLHRQADGKADSYLGQNFPNPFNPSTTIVYEIGHVAHVVLDVYDVTGKKIETLVDRYQQIGVYQVRWTADNASGRRLASGMYIARLEVDGLVSVKAMNFIK